MTTTTGPRALPELARELADFLGLPADLDLPKLHAVSLSRNGHDSEWTVTAQLAGASSDLERWEEMCAWSAIGTSGVVLGDVHMEVGGGWRRISTVVSFVGVRVTVWNHVSADFEVPVGSVAA